MTSTTTPRAARALTIAAALCGLALARPATVLAPSACAHAGAAAAEDWGLVPVEGYLDLGAPATGAGDAAWRACPLPWQAEPEGSAPAVSDPERRYVDVGALRRRSPHDPPAR